MTAESIYSSSWYRVAPLRPRIRPQVQVHRHRYHNVTWYVLADDSAGTQYRVSTGAWYLVGLMDGKRDVDTLWQLTQDALGEQAPSQDETIKVIGQLYANELIAADVAPDTTELIERKRKASQSGWAQRARSPLAIRIPVFDPHRILDSLAPYLHPLFNRFTGFAVLILLGAGISLVMSNWEALGSDAVTRVLSPNNLLLLWLLYPLVKMLHEFGHAVVVRHYGGEVHEMGIMLLALLPMPYVDASATSSFRKKSRRMLVGAAGIIVEISLATVALMVWLITEPGLVRTIAYDVMLIGGVSTLLFNGNPLLRFDAYYILADAVEIPNLATRASAYLRFVIADRILGAQGGSSPAHNKWERNWFIGYGILAAIYRVFVVVAITWFVAARYPLIGMAVAIWAVAIYLVWPLGRFMKFLRDSSQLDGKRSRAVGACTAFVFSIVLLIAVVPVPRATLAQGVIRPPDNAWVRAGADCLIEQLNAKPGEYVTQGQLLFRCDASIPTAQYQVAKGIVAEVESRNRAMVIENPTAAVGLAEQRDNALVQLERAQQRLDAVEVRAPVSGWLVIPRAQDLVGRFVSQGGLLAYVVDYSAVRVRVAISQSDIETVRHQTKQIALKTLSNERTLTALMMNETPSAGMQLPSAALGSSAGGAIAVAADDEQGLRTQQPVFMIDLQPQGGALPPTLGARVYARFDHGAEPLLRRIHVGFKRLFLSRLNG